MVERNLDISAFFDAAGRITHWPAKKHGARRRALLVWLASTFEGLPEMAEKEVNDHLQQRHTFSDPAYLRRELVDAGLLGRTRDCTRYWLIPQSHDEAILRL